MNPLANALAAALKEVLEAEKAWNHADWQVYCQERRTNAGKAVYNRVVNERCVAGQRREAAKASAEALLKSLEG